MEIVIGKDGDRDVAVDAQELVTGRTCIIAQSGAGKSWSIAVICEQLLQARVGFCLIDTEGEYSSLRDRFHLLWIGSGDDCDIDIERANLRELMHNAICSRTAVIFDVSETDMREKVTLLADLLYDLESGLKKPFLLIVEEADKFIPQSGESIKKIEEISRRGRKRGLGMLVATQRPSLVTKNVLSQCNNQIIGKLSIENDLKAVGLFFSSRKEVAELAELEPGEFFVMGSLSREKVKMRFRDRLCEHRGLTPKLVPARPVRPAEAPRAEPAHTEPARAKPCDPEESRRESTDSPQAAANAVIPVLLREEALDIAKGKRKRRFLILEPEERIVSGERVYRPLHRIDIRYIGGILRRATKTASFLIDGPTGCIVEMDRGLKVRPGFSELLGLDEAAVRVVAGLANGGSTLTEIEADTHLPPAAVKKAIKSLAGAKLITEMKTVGDTTVYVPLLAEDVPAFSSLRPGSVDLSMEPLREEPLEAKATESSLRTVIKGLEPTAEIVGFDTIYYPVYLIRFASERGERSLVLDGCTGRELLFPGS